MTAAATKVKTTKPTETTISRTDETASQTASQTAIDYVVLKEISLALVAEIDNLMTSNIAPQAIEKHLGNIVAGFNTQISKLS
tara:strand:+ start:152 stop:400 length:249 start_codon:yes stop_codon:yes gene_type:complete